ncbi:hypothetical protein KEM56_005485 [Ascosphaera pollenicola]|nr:hypothetical protein KEM56_005485 [Ascosphaera pollenicola]
MSVRASVTSFTARTVANSESGLDCQSKDEIFKGDVRMKVNTDFSPSLVTLPPRMRHEKARRSCCLRCCWIVNGTLSSIDDFFESAQMVSSSYWLPATPATRTFVFSSIADVHARLREAISLAGDDDHYVIFTQTPICVLDQLEENKLLKIVHLDNDNNTATLVFRAPSTAHEAAKGWIHLEIDKWKDDHHYYDIWDCGQSGKKQEEGERAPDGAWGPAFTETTQRKLIIEVGYSQSVEDMEEKLEYWFDAGVTHAILMDLVKERREISLHLWCGNPHRRVSSIKVREEDGGLVKEGGRVSIPPAAIAARGAREDDVDLKITVAQLAKAAPQIFWRFSHP